MAIDRRILLGSGGRASRRSLSLAAGGQLDGRRAGNGGARAHCDGSAPSVVSAGEIEPERFAILRLEQGEELAVVSRILGHASITTTANVYGHLSDAMLRRAADRTEVILGSRMASSA